jgi:hypothetical protein
MRYNAKYLKIHYLSIGETSDAGLKLSCSTNAKKIFSNYLEHYIDICHSANKHKHEKIKTNI